MQSVNLSTGIGHFEIETIHAVMETLPDGKYFDELKEGLESAITLIQTHVLDLDDLEAIS